MDRLQDALGRLAEALDHDRTLDEERRQRVCGALAQLEAAIGEPGDMEPGHRETFAELVEHFAEEHPQLSEALGRVVDQLSQLGI